MILTDTFQDVKAVNIELINSGKFLLRQFLLLRVLLRSVLSLAKPNWLLFPITEGTVYASVHEWWV